MKKIYKAPYAEIIDVETKDIMSLSLGNSKDPYVKDPFIIGGAI